MQTQARVIAVDGKFATVETVRTSACEGCHKSAEGSCSVCSLMGAGKKTFSTRALNTPGACVGDTVRIESLSGRMLFYAALIFILPLAVAFLCWGVSTAFTESAVWQTACALIGLCGTFLAVFIYSGIVSKKRCDVEITEIITPEKQTADDGRAN